MHVEGRDWMKKNTPFRGTKKLKKTLQGVMVKT